MKKILFLISLFFFAITLNAQVTLNHNVGNIPIKNGWVSCEYEEYWAKTFKLSDFGISNTEQFILRSGQVAISNSYEGARILFNVYSVDENFPNSEPKRLSYGNSILAPEIGDSPQIVTIDFVNPVVIPSNVERVLIEVTQLDDIYNPNYKKVLIAGTTQDNDISWFKGCREHYSYISTEDLSNPLPNANFFINITGEKLSTINSSTNINLSHNIGDVF